MSFEGGPGRSWPCSREPPATLSSLPLDFLPQPTLSDSSRTCSPMSSGCPWAGSGSGTWEHAPFYAAPGHWDWCMTGWWHYDTGVIGTPHEAPPATPLHSVLWSQAFGVLAPRQPLCPGGPRGCPCPWWSGSGYSFWASLSIHLCIPTV